MATVELSETRKAILHALKDMDSACGTREIAAATGLDGKRVGAELNALKKQGLVESPARCRYSITEAGRTAAA